MERLLDKKQIRVIFLFEFKMGHKEAEVTCNINSVFGRGTTMYSGVVVQEVLQRRQAPGRWGVQWVAIGSWQRPTERITETDPLTTAREVAQELSIDHSMVIQHLKQVGKVKKLVKWVPHELIKNLKNHHFEISSFILCSNNKLFLCWIVKGDKKWILYNDYWCPAQWLDWKEAPKHFPKPNLHQKKTVMVTVWWSAACLIHYSFLNPGKTMTSEKYAQPVDEMHQKRQGLQPALVTRRARSPPDDAQLHAAATASKVARIGLPSFAPSAILTCPLANWLPLLQASLQLFAGKMLL